MHDHKAIRVTEENFSVFSSDFHFAKLTDINLGSLDPEEPVYFVVNERDDAIYRWWTSPARLLFEFFEFTEPEREGDYTPLRHL